MFSWRSHNCFMLQRSDSDTWNFQAPFLILFLSLLHTSATFVVQAYSPIHKNLTDLLKILVPAIFKGEDSLTSSVLSHSVPNFPFASDIAVLSLHSCPHPAFVPSPYIFPHSQHHCPYWALRQSLQGPSMPSPSLIPALSLLLSGPMCCLSPGGASEPQDYWLHLFFNICLGASLP